MRARLRGLRHRRAERAARVRELAAAIEARGWRLADGPLARLIGWMGRRGVASSAGLCLMPCRAIHTLFMRFPIDVVFLSIDGTVLRRIERLPPGRTAAFGIAFAVLELPAGAAAAHGLAVGRNVIAERDTDRHDARLVTSSQSAAQLLFPDPTCRT